MSGVVGLFRRDGGPVSVSDVRPMVSIIAHRGPDGNGVVNSGPVGLGHAMLWTTPESLREALPRTDPSSALTITADARIDNREELFEALGISEPPGSISDSE